MKKNKIQVSVPFIHEKSRSNARSVLRSDWLSPNGQFSGRFRDKLAAYNSAAGAVLTNSGTSALEIAIHAIAKIYRIDDRNQCVIVVPAHTCPDSAIAAVKAGFKIVVSDTDDRGLMTRKTLADAVTRVNSSNIKNDTDFRVVGVMPVYILGMAPAIDLYDTARSLGLFVVDDCAEAMGALVDSWGVGIESTTIADATCFSFRGEKPFPIGTGGGIVSNHTGIIETANSMIGMNSLGKFNRYLSLDMAYSYEMPEVMAAFGVGQFDGYAENLAARRMVVSMYGDRFNEDKSFWREDTLLTPIPFGHYDIPWKMLVKTAVSSLDAWTMFSSAGIETSPPYVPLHRLDFLKPHLVGHDPDSYINKEHDFVADGLWRNSVMLPVHHEVSEDDVSAICNVLAAAIQGRE